MDAGVPRRTQALIFITISNEWMFMDVDLIVVDIH